MAQQRVAAVAGAAGFVGSAVVRELLGRGYQVRGLVRSRDKAAAALPRDERLRLVVGDATTSAAARDLVAGAWACVNAIGLLRETDGRTFRKAHVDSVRSLVNGCREGGAGRFVQVSALGVSAEGKTEYQRSKYDGEQIVRRSGLAWTILRPGLIHGARGEFMQMAKAWVKGEKQPWFFLPYFTRAVPMGDVPLAPIKRVAATIAPVAVEDVAWAVAESLEREDAIGEVFNLVGPERLTWPEFLVAIRDAVPGAREDLDPIGIPAQAAAMQAKVAKMLGLGGLLPFDEGMPVMGSSDSLAEAEKARQLLGFEPRPFFNAMREYAVSM